MLHDGDDVINLALPFTTLLRGSLNIKGGLKMLPWYLPYNEVLNSSQSRLRYHI